jgi:hypothetical protein
LPITLVSRGSRALRAGVEWSKETLSAADVHTLDALPLVRAARAVVHQMQRAGSVARAVQDLDMACFNDLVSIAEVTEELAGLGGRPGISTVRSAVALAVENSWSPTETRLRLAWLEEIPTTLLSNQPVFGHDGRLIATPDLLDPTTGVIGEYQGQHHLDRAQRRRDVEREGLLRDAGLELLEVWAGEPASTFRARLRAAYARAARLPAEHRRWTTTAPVGWKQTTTVAQRRALGERDRARLLAHRSIDRAA